MLLTDSMIDIVLYEVRTGRKAEKKLEIVVRRPWS